MTSLPEVDDYFSKTRNGGCWECGCPLTDDHAYARVGGVMRWVCEPCCDAMETDEPESMYGEPDDHDFAYEYRRDHEDAR